MVKNRGRTRCYHALEWRFGQIGRLQSAAAILSWDTETMMPRGSAKDRAEQLGTLNVMIHRMLSDPRVGRWLDGVESESLDPWQLANVAAMARLHRHERALSAKLVKRFTRVTSACQMAWREARPGNDFASYRPHLEKVFEVVRQRADAKAEVLGCTPYDALLDEHDPGSRVVRLDGLFAAVKSFLPGLIDAVITHQQRRSLMLPLDGPFSVDDQRILGERVVEALGFDFERGRLDISLHPSTGGTPDDVRITTRYNETCFAESLMGVIHEAGHALYDMGLPETWRYQPVGQARGMAVHESQALIIEMQACRSAPFFRWAAPLIREIFGKKGPAWEPENLYLHYTRVERGLIRVDADSVTYPAHVVMRYDLERRLIEGSLKVAELPEAWREQMLALVGVAPCDDRDGCMQDVHWAEGIVGYFPSYTVGAMAAAQLYEQALRDKPEIPECIAAGDFGPLVTWLNQAIHRHGTRFGIDELLQRATGSELDPGVYEASLRRRYLG